MKKALSFALAFVIALALLPALPAAAADISDYPIVSQYCPSGEWLNGAEDYAFSPQYNTQVKSISTLHWNGGAGAAPGSITLFRLDMKQYTWVPLGTWEAVARDGNTWWDVFLDVALTAGEIYFVHDSDPDTRTYASEDEYRFGITELRGIADISMPAVTPAPEPTTTITPKPEVDDPDVLRAVERIREAALAGETEIDAGDMALTMEQYPAVLDLLENDPECFWFSANFHWTNSSLTKIKLSYKEGYDGAALEAAVRRALSCILPGMNDLQKMLVLHDYLDTHVAYDYDNYLAGTVPDVSHTAYGPLVLGTGVCEGYTQAYRLLLHRCGISTSYVSSEAMNHGWTLVQLNGAWYHVDVTWDDPVPDQPGRARHMYFLLSDDAISDAKHKHYAWNAEHTCTDTRYDSGAPWEEMDSHFIFSDADSIWRLEFDDHDPEGVTSLVCRSWSTGRETVAATIRGFWPVWGAYQYEEWDGSITYSSYWMGSYSGLCLWDRRIFINDKDNIYAYDPAEKTLETVYTYRGQDGYIFGIDFDGDTLVARICQDPDEAGTLCRVTLEHKYPYNIFSDIFASDYYYDAVQWAVEAGVTKGTGSDAAGNPVFSPNDTVKRGQAVTFLWRAMGEPEPEAQGNPFADVKETDYFYKAVLWAVEKGITNGTKMNDENGQSWFSPDDPVTRGQMLTFLWRTAGEPGKTGEGPWYADAERWGDATGCIYGTAEPYATAEKCPRCDVVYYLWQTVPSIR